MHRVILRLAAALVILSSTVVAQTFPVGGSGSSSITANTTATSGCTDASVLWSTSNIVRCSGTAKIVASPSGASATSNLFNVTGNLPGTLSAEANGLLFAPTTAAGTDNFDISGLRVTLGSGYTGAGQTAAGFFRNNVVSGSAFTGIGTSGAVGVIGYSTAGLQAFGGVFGASGGSSASTGLVSIGSDLGASILYGSPTAPPGFFAVSAALYVNNGTGAVPVARFDDNDTAVFQIGNGGTVWTKVGTKTLTESTPTAFVEIAVTSNGRQSGYITYSIDANDATDYQTRSGVLYFAATNKAGTEVCSLFRAEGSTTVDGTTDGVAVDSGTLTNTFTCSTSASNAIQILADAASSLTQTTLRINYTVYLTGNAATTVTPQ